MDKVIDEVAVENNVSVDLLRRLIDYEQGRVHLERRRGAMEDLKRLIEENMDRDTR